MSTQIVREAVETIGGLAATGRACDVTPQAVEYWIRTGRVPAKRLKDFIYALEKEGGEADPEQLNPYVVFM